MSTKPAIAVLAAADEGWPPGLEALEGEAELKLCNDRGSLSRHLPEADILLVTDFRTELLEDVWPREHRIGWIHATSAGVDALMIPPIRDSAIPVTNARGVFDRPIAEFVLGLVLSFAKDFPGSLRYQQQCRWQHRDTERIEGQQALVVGAGSIGRQIARLLGAVGMRVDGVARSARDSDPDFERVHPADSLLEHLPDADFVVIAAPLTDDTRGLFGAGAFRAMKTSARLINIGRGPIVQTDALIRALEAGELAGAGLDVFEEEPLPADHPLWGFPNVLISAHMAGDVVGWRETLIRQFIDHFRCWQQGRDLPNQVDKARGYVPPAS
ncbi:MAG: D-2-hydroxyacid dehydrogenase [Ectothiorhodospiraceae bacterium]|nr:D-2-hydroxyacid dehydrogenase [Ectothiorhodospiraceae bacterium]